MHIEPGVLGADFVYTDGWLSEDEGGADRIQLLSPFRATGDVMEATENPFAKFMHCLPALHDTKTEVCALIAKEYEIDGTEVSDEVLESKASIVFDQADNRMQTIKAVLVATIEG